MYEALALSHLINRLEEVLEDCPDKRNGKNTRYDLSDAGLGAFSVFFIQSPSFLAHQRAMQVDKGRCNAERLFGLRNIPSDTLRDIRNLLDPISPTQLRPMYRHVFQALEHQVVLTPYRSFGQQLLVALDGTEYFSSKKIHCAQCSQRVLAASRGETRYFHSVLTPVIVQPGHPQVITLEPEFIVPQDGHDKQDCELQALAGNARRFLCFPGRDAPRR